LKEKENSMSIKKIIALVVVVVLLAATLPNTFAQEEGITNVCLVTDLGRVNDGTFNQFAYEGMIMAEEEYDLDTSFIETQAETDYAPNIDTCVQEGYDAIVTVGFLIADATRAAAEANPDRYFIGVDQFVVDGPPNYVGLQFNEDQAGFLAGVLAGMVTESGTVAGVYGIDIPPVVKFRNGFEQGVAFVNAVMGTDTQTLGVYIDDFLAPDRGASAAEQFIGDGADVIFGAGGPTGSGGILQAAQQGVYVIGVDQDEYFTTFGEGETPGAEFLISSAMKRVDLGVRDLLGILAEGRMDEWPGGSIFLGQVGFGPKHDSDVPDAAYDVLQQLLDMILAGELETGVDPATGEVVTPISEMEIDFEIDLGE
jgi:basic membrane lipoprotein Med (substrate-binding protein (PBP1-ABC) superfamily)